MTDAPRLPVSRQASSPDGPFDLTPKLLASPLEGCPTGISSAEYFQGMEDFLAEDGYAALLAAASAECGRDLALDDAAGIVLRMEKHGTYYHPASVELVLRDGGRTKLCLLAATSLIGFLAMEEEYETIRELSAAFPYGRLPRVHAQADRESMAFMLAQWIEDRHEFHVSSNGRTILWDYSRGLRELSSAQVFAVYEQAAHIAGLYYDLASGRRIHPWHHAAGDFIAGLSASGEVRVDLCSARGREPILENDGGPDFAARALTAFFLDLTLRLRLDRMDGTGETVFLDERVLEAGLYGFFSAAEIRGYADKARRMARDLTTASPDALTGALDERLSQFGPTDKAVLAPRLNAHAAALSSRLPAFARPPRG